MLVFFWSFNCFINNVTNLLKVMHHILHQKQECCQRVSQSIYNHVLYDSIGKKAFYVQINFYLPAVRHPAVPVIFHDFLPVFDSLLCSPSNSSLLVLFCSSHHSPPFPAPQKKAHTPSAFIYKLSPINRSFQLRSAAAKAYPLWISRSPLDLQHTLQTLWTLVKPQNCQNTWKF